MCNAVCGYVHSVSRGCSSSAPQELQTGKVSFLIKLIGFYRVYIIHIHLVKILTSAEKQNYFCLFCPESCHGLLSDVFQCTLLSHPCESTLEVKVFRVARGKKLGI